MTVHHGPDGILSNIPRVEVYTQAGSDLTPKNWSFGDYKFKMLCEFRMKLKFILIDYQSGLIKHALDQY